MGEDWFFKRDLFIVSPNGERTRLEVGNLSDRTETVNFGSDYRPEFEVTARVKPTEDLVNAVGKMTLGNSSYFSMQFKSPSGQVPARRHKKWRVQKKWIKRYGMRTTYTTHTANFPKSQITNNFDGTCTVDFEGYLVH
jgi:hypothetical protein